MPRLRELFQISLGVVFAMFLLSLTPASAAEPLDQVMSFVLHLPAIARDTYLYPQ